MVVFFKKNNVYWGGLARENKKRDEIQMYISQVRKKKEINLSKFCNLCLTETPRSGIIPI